SAATGVDRLAPGLALAATVAPSRVRRLAFTRRASRVVGRTDASVVAAARLLRAAPGVVDAGDAASEPSEPGSAGSPTVAVRARDVRGTAGVSTSDAERALGDVLVERGFAVDLEDPDRELRALFAGDVCVLGWLAVAAERGFGERAPTERPFFQPGSMAPQLARGLVNLALPGPEALDGARLLDPMCGTGGVCLEAGLVDAAPVGLDAQRKMVHGTRRNLRHLLPGDAVAAGPGGAGGGFPDDPPWSVLRGDAARLPLRDGAVDAVVFDAPYGRQSKVVSRSTERLVGDALGESRRVVRDDPPATAGPGRVVVVGDRDWSDAAATAGLSVRETFARPVHRSLTRHVVVCETG
ncbi:MAG: TIGR01177 family methyltransferase, partial [Halobacteriaceae archaeon]